MSFDARSAGAVIGTLDDHQQRTVPYLAVLPNLLVSLHPHYAMVHRLDPVRPELTRISCSWAFPPEAPSKQADRSSAADGRLTTLACPESADRPFRIRGSRVQGALWAT